MHRLVPGFIQEQFAAGRTTGSFDACALFVDISGFTPITDALTGHGQHGAEVLANIIQDLFDPLMQSVFAQGGFVTNLFGDAFMAIFPANEGSHTACARALAAAWKIQRGRISSALRQTPYGDFPVSVKVGLAFGTVAWGIVSSRDTHRATYYFQGPAIEGCTFAQSLASSGEIVVEASVLEILGAMVVVTPIVDHFQIKGVEGSLPVPKPIHPHSDDPDILKRFFPPKALQKKLTAEFRQVVTMFVSLPTVRTVEQLRMFLQIVFALQDHYGGLLSRLEFGDKGANLLLFWGAPVAHENDVARALNFALDLRSKTVIPVKAGITYGTAHCGYSGGELAGEYTCHGRGTTLAARLMQAAPRGEVWVDENVAARAESRFEIEFEEEMAFKGFVDPQRVFVLLERKEAQEPFYRSQFVGRDTEKEKLIEFVRPIWQGHYADVVMIWGDPGIGKTRLVHAFLDDLERDANREFSMFVCQADEILREALNPFRYWLRRYFGQSEQQSEARNKRSFNRKLDRLIARTHDKMLAAELDRTRSFLGALIDLHWPDSLYEQLDALGRYENSFAGLHALLLAESSRRPVILFLEDVQWLDGDSETLLRQLLPRLAAQTYPIAIVATARLEGDQTPFGSDIAHREINLGQMSTADQATLAAAQLGSPGGPDLLALLAKRAEGNPFFAEQILRYLQEQDLLQLADGVWHLRAREATTLPTDVRAVLVARLDRLSRSVKEVVQTASVLGREFEIQLLAHMLQDDPAIREKVAQAEGMLIWTALTEIRYIFRHGLLRDAAYRMQIRARRQALHKLAAEALETLHEHELSPYYGELAYHSEQAGLLDKARRYLALAGESARDAYQNSRAIDYYTRLVELTPDDDVEGRFTSLLAREALYERLGATQAQLQDLDEITALAEQLEDDKKQLQALLRRAWYYWWTADYAASQEICAQAIKLAEETGQHESAAEANYVNMWVKLQQGANAEARRYGETALRNARQAEDRKMEARILSGLGFISRAEGDYYAARQQVEQSLSTYRDIGDHPNEGTALGNLGVQHMTLGDYEAAEACFREALVIKSEIGSKIYFGSDLINLCWKAETVGDWEAAIQYGEEGLAVIREVNQPEMEAEGLLWLGHAWLGAGQIEKARHAYRKSLKIRRELGQDYLAMGVLAGMSRLALAQGDLNAAAAYVAEIMSYLDAGGSLDSTWEPLRIYFTCFQVLHLTGDPRAWEVLETSYQKLQSLAAKIPDAEARSIYVENVPWHRAIVVAHGESP